MSRQSGFDDAEARRIIARAAEIDAQDKPLDVHALREIAERAGISAASVEQALAEQSERPQNLIARLRRRPGVLALAAILGLLLLIMLQRLVVNIPSM